MREFLEAKREFDPAVIDDIPRCSSNGKSRQNDSDGRVMQPGMPD